MGIVCDTGNIWGLLEIQFSCFALDISFIIILIKEHHFAAPLICSSFLATLTEQRYDKRKAEETIFVIEEIEMIREEMQ